MYGNMEPRTLLPAVAINSDLLEDANGQAARNISVTSQQYIDAVSDYAKRTTRGSLYPGHVFEDLAALLRRAHAPQSARLPSNDDLSKHQRLPTSTLYTMRESEPRTRQVFADAQKCVEVLQADKAEPHAHILFLRGYPSPEWLSRIGSLCLTDPEFFNSHLRFRWRRNYFSFPSLPSSAEPIIRLRFATIGSREAKSHESDQKSVDRLRADGVKAMRKYNNELLIGTTLNQGDSIIRDFFVLDEKHFIIEQEISICLNYVEKNWIALVLTDIGSDLSRGPQGPWLTSQDRDPHSISPWTLFYPTIQHRPRIALRADPSNIRGENVSKDKFPQSAGLLAQDYGNLLDMHTMMMDPFYAMTDLFRFFTHSEVQFLNMMEAIICIDTGHSSLSKDTPTLSNLLYCREIIEAHLSRLLVSIRIIAERGSSKWPHVPKQRQAQCERAEMTAKALREDFEHLAQRAESLIGRCTRGMDLTMNNVMLAESRQATLQARGVAKLTLVAFFYIPLSFTTSFFGMNFIELDQGLSLWIWFATSAPVFLFSLCFLFLDLPKLKAFGRKFVKKT